MTRRNYKLLCDVCSVEVLDRPHRTFAAEARQKAREAGWRHIPASRSGPARDLCPACWNREAS